VLEIRVSLSWWFFFVSVRSSFVSMHYVSIILCSAIAGALQRFMSLCGDIVRIPGVKSKRSHTLQNIVSW
jgi:hypothetical protein